MKLHRRNSEHVAAASEARAAPRKRRGMLQQQLCAQQAAAAACLQHIAHKRALHIHVDLRVAGRMHNRLINEWACMIEEVGSEATGTLHLPVDLQVADGMHDRLIIHSISFI